ncbi:MULTISPECIES: response regulator transcription factor [Brevibacillus]|uniref:Response regulator receiver domain-containing protein n=2 Tax=Brevibacillus TaxID=55080 RepID=A0A1I4DYG8_9BACL|nr:MULTISPECIES: response regulator transcription factor [Brevibacillus]MEC2132047.1 helix-turn-helix domain-containing protein [Brevibacillus centrosporus]MED1954246.1 helix-turn-helix domain-containing protein [Brevibacillus centrosporus]MED4911491.1 helix-turn-helix domain-containing protein [Brevibacillus centrosporus]RNB65825.1 AraC family transcriptional regulator [Brevibacillus centrosporus]RNB85258.1 AraC family transcriptional regulator [Brevibacillus nitrificans]
MSGLLIIDDEIESSEDIRSILMGSQYNYLPIYECDSAQKGLGLVRNYHPNMVILDLSLPDLDGIECGKMILEQSPHIPVVVLTHIQMFEVVQAVINAGFSGYLLKPVSKIEFLGTLNRLLIPQLFKETQSVRKPGVSQEPVEIDFGNPIQSAIHYIHSQYHEPITLNDVADRVYLSGSHFSRLFKAEMRITFIEYLTKHRVEQAKKLLKMTSLPIEVIANNAGFTNAGYFATTFKRLENITPSEYRQMFSSLLS